MGTRGAEQLPANQVLQTAGRFLQQHTQVFQVDDRDENDPVLNELVHLLQGYDPEQIILFGWRARDEADEYSTRTSRNQKD